MPKNRLVQVMILLKNTQITNFNTHPEVCLSSEIPEFIKNALRQVSAH